MKVVSYACCGSYGAHHKAGCRQARIEELSAELAAALLRERQLRDAVERVLERASETTIFHGPLAEALDDLHALAGDPVEPPA